MQRLLMILVSALGIIAIAIAAVALLAHSEYRERMAEAETAYAAIATRVAPVAETFSPEMIADLPEIARRYFTHAIAPGTPPSTTVELVMEGRFILGEKDSPQEFDMRARQILAPPGDFVWI